MIKVYIARRNKMCELNMSVCVLIIILLYNAFYSFVKFKVKY